MISPLATGLLKSVNNNEISALSGAEGTLSGLNEDGFATEFSNLLQGLLSPDGNLQPLELADLKGIDRQQLSDLLTQLGIELPPELLAGGIDTEQLPLTIVPSDIANAAARDIGLVGNPTASAVLKTKLINAALVDEASLAKQANTLELIASNIKDNNVQQSLVKKGAELSLTLAANELDVSENFLKKFSLGEIDLNDQLLSQASRQDGSATKLVDSLANIDRPMNPITSFVNPALQTYSNQEPSTLMLRRIDVPVQQAAWGEAVGNRLMMMVNDKVQSAQIHLNPPELGPIEVRVNVNQDQASVHFVSNNSIVRDAIDEAFPRLKEMFAQNGLSLNDANVSQQSAQQGNSNLREQNDVNMMANNEVQEADDTETAPVVSVSTGLIDQYV